MTRNACGPTCRLIFQPLTVSQSLSTKYSSPVLHLSRRLCAAVLLYPSSRECLDGPCFAAAPPTNSHERSQSPRCWRSAFSAPSCNGRIRAGEEGKKSREESKEGKCCERAAEIAEYFIPSRSAVLPKSWKWNRKTSRASKSEESEKSRFA